VAAPLEPLSFIYYLKRPEWKASFMHFIFVYLRPMTANFLRFIVLYFLAVESITIIEKWVIEVMRQCRCFGVSLGPPSESCVASPILRFKSPKFPISKKKMV
jgi:hypothetical protein